MPNVKRESWPVPQRDSTNAPADLTPSLRVPVVTGREVSALGGGQGVRAAVHVLVLDLVFMVDLVWGRDSEVRVGAGG